jgi:hypothetical protein
MKTLLLAGACAMLISVPALACRGTAEYPELAAQLAKRDLPAEQKDAYGKKLKEGEALHRQGHDRDNKALRDESLKILDELKAAIAN